MFNYDEIAIPGRINTHIRKFWILDNSSSLFSTEMKYALPNGCVTMAFVTGEGLALRYDQKPFDIGSGVYFSGQITGRVQIIVRPFTKAIMVQLSPWVASIFVNEPRLDELTDNLAELGLVNKKLARLFQGIDLSDESLLVQKVCSMLEESDIGSDHNLIRSVFYELNTAPADRLLTISGIASKTGYSKRYIEKKFKDHVGLSPKEAYSIVKLRNLIGDLGSPTNSLSLTDLAYKYGYFDQAHFIRSYAKIIGDTPSKFSRQQYILPFKT
ncbi:helix-turn-helix domain-containing protein [Mucilaginibacter sp.]|jgi:AraC-like DNA-binding protein|uniref:AraC family transcriptional regulator n=1 Tax=Mucilaginibacter sp. TaxID=1882438 RepID=UPI002BE4CE33|nr:helix-turn-helix domain-containing protein [Mucilaginibacter sp.]HTI59721.1 helix-turn-helix domain-containing protein [Mucilaginibacter sp.]